MFDRLAALRLNGFENVLMFPSGDPSFLAGGASGLDCAALATNVYAINKEKENTD